MKAFSLAACLLLLSPALLASELQDIRKSIIHPAVKITVGYSKGSGTAIRKLDNGKTLILTNWHVVAEHVRTVYYREGRAPWQKKPLIQVTKFIWDERGKLIEQVNRVATLVQYNVITDLALLEVELNIPLLPLATPEEFATLETLQKVSAVGCPLGRNPTYTEGRISQLALDVFGIKFIRSTADIINGSSGGSLVVKFESGWRLIGVPSRMSQFQSNPVTYLGLSAPVDQVRELISGWEKGKNDKESVNSACREVWLRKNNDCSIFR